MPTLNAVSVSSITFFVLVVAARIILPARQGYGEAAPPRPERKAPRRSPGRDYDGAPASLDPVRVRFALRFHRTGEAVIDSQAAPAG